MEDVRGYTTENTHEDVKALIKSVFHCIEKARTGFFKAFELSYLLLFNSLTFYFEEFTYALTKLISRKTTTVLLHSWVTLKKRLQDINHRMIQWTALCFKDEVKQFYSCHLHEFFFAKETLDSEIQDLRNHLYQNGERIFCYLELRIEDYGLYQLIW